MNKPVKSITIHAILKTLSQLHIAAPGSFRFDPSTGYVNSGTDGGFACTGIQRLRLAPNAVDGVMTLPVIAGNNIAGNLRTAASRILIDALKANNQKIEMSTYSAITCGAVTGKPDGRDLSYAEQKESSAHPFVGPFGGGPRMLKKKLRAHNALPVMEVLREVGFTISHPSRSGRAMKPGDVVTHGWAFVRKDHISALTDVARMEGSINNFEAKLLERQTLILSDKQAKDDDEKGSRHSTRTISAIEFVDPGVDFEFTVELLNVTDEQIGLILLALEAFANQQLGGWVRNGLGRISLNDVVIADHATGDVSDSIFNNNTLDRTKVRAYVDAWQAAALTLTGEQLDRIMKPPVDETEESKAEKAQKKAEKAAAKVTAKAAK